MTDQIKPDDVFHAVGYTTRDIGEGSHLRLLELSMQVMQENEKLWRALGPLVPATHSGKVERNLVEVLSVSPFPNGEMPYEAPPGEMYLSIELPERLGTAALP